VISPLSFRSRDPAIAGPSDGTQGGSSPDPKQLALDYAHSLTGDNAIRLLYSDGIKRY
jgi:hypothetical protein